MYLTDKATLLAGLITILLAICLVATVVSNASIGDVDPFEDDEVGDFLETVHDNREAVFAAAAVGVFVDGFVALVFARDIYILLAVVGIMALTKVRRFPPSRWGKLSTFAQIVAAVAWMVTNIWPVSVLHAISSATLWVSAGFTVWSGTHYTLRGVQTLRAR